MLTVVEDVAGIDRDLAELQRKRAKARLSGEHDYVLVLSEAINRKLDDRRATTAPR